MIGRRRNETMEENRAKLIAAARKAFAANGFAASSMDDLTADAGLTRGRPVPRRRTIGMICSRRVLRTLRWHSIPRCGASCCWTDPLS